MKKTTIISVAIISILATVSCSEKPHEEGFDPGVPTTLSATLSPTADPSRTALGPKEGSAYPNLWAAGDKICVNGITSAALDAAEAGTATAKFTFEPGLSTPYYAAYPAAAASGYSAGSATLTVPASQAYVEGSYDPAAYVMAGKSSTPGVVTLTPRVSIIHLTLTGSASISKIKLTSNDAAVSGSFTTDFNSTFEPKAVSNVVEVNPASAVALPAEFFICVPAGLSGSFTADVFDDSASKGYMQINGEIPSGQALAAGQMYSSPSIAYVPSYDLHISAEGITSSTAVICWDDPTPGYIVGVYSDPGCTSLIDSYEIPAGDPCWGDDGAEPDPNPLDPRFCISGLTGGTTYYVKVHDTINDKDSNVLTVITSPFTVVEASSDPAAVGQVILAEDFSEFRWDCDMIGSGAGWFPTAEAQAASFETLEIGSFQAAATSNEKQISAQTNPVAASRLAHWAQGANPHMYVHPGYIKLVGQKKVTHIVTPALDCIPAGKIATVEVEVTASAYYSESSSSFCTTHAIVAVQTGTLNDLVDETKTNSLDLESNIQEITLDEATAWKTYKVTLSNVVKGNRIAFGARSDISGNDARMNVSDIKVTLTALEDLTLTASLNSVSSSTAAFTWTYGGDAADDVTKPYTAALYRDDTCTDLVASYAIPAGSGCWDGKKPVFVFAGLTPSTDYWFKVTDTDASVESAPVACTTSAFTVVDATTVSNAGVGDVILAEDFSEIGWGVDQTISAAGFIPSTKLLLVPSGAYTAEDGSFTNSGNARRLYGDTQVTSDKRLYHWGFYGNSSVFAQAAFLRVGASDAGARTHIVSPALNGIPDGMEATIDVTVTARQYLNNTNNVAVFVENASDMSLVVAPDDKDNENFSARGGKYNGASLTNGYAFDIKTTTWETKTLRIKHITNENRLLFGSYEHIDTKNRFFISDVKVTIVELKVPGAVEQVVEISDFATFKEFLTACGTGKTIQGDVVADITLTSEQLAEIDALYPVAEFDGIVNGNSHTIAGLTKPLFDQFSGTASNLTLNSTLNIADAQDEVGIFAMSASNATLTGCVSTGSLTHASATEVDGDLFIGGLIGRISGSTLVGCHNEANVTNTTTATEYVRMGGLIGAADGANTLTGTETVFNYNKSVILENSASEKVAVGGVCGYTFGAASDFAYAQEQIQDGADVDDIIIRDNTRDKVYAGGIIGMSANTSSFNYASNVDADVCFHDLTMSATGQVFGGGIIGGWSASGEQTITGCTNSGWVYTKTHADASKVANTKTTDIGVGDTATPLWSLFGGIAGMGSTGTSEGLNSGFNTITGKTFTNCTMSGRVLIYCQVRCCIGGVVAYTENDPIGCVCTNNIRLLKLGGIGSVGSNYHRQIVGGVVGYFNGSSATNLKYNGTINTSSSSPFAYTSGVIGYLNTSAVELNNCRIGGSVRAAGKDQGRNAVMCHNNTNTVSVTFTNCLIKKGLVTYATGSKVTINADSDVTAGQCMGQSDANYTIVGDVLPTVADSID